MLIGVGLALAGVAVAVGWLRRTYVAVTVVGDSMAPTFRSGQRVLARRRTRRGGPLRRAEVAVFRPPTAVVDGDVVLRVKRIAAIAGDPIPGSTDRVPAAMVYVLGDNRKHSEDSRGFGCVAEAAIVATIRAR